MAVAHPYAELPLILVTGVGRSGTTALRNALACHPRLHSTERENNIVLDVLDVARRNCTVPSRKHAMRTSQARYAELFRALLLDLLWPDARDPLPAAITGFTGLTLETADYLGRVFPRVQVVHLVRNGIEVVSSRMRFPSFAVRSFEENCRTWAELEALLDWGADRPGTLLVRHEQLVNPSIAPAALDEIWRFAGLAPCAPALEHLLGTLYHPTDDGPADRSPAEVAADRQDRWMGWNQAQRDGFVAICGPLMRRLGYGIPWDMSGAASTAAAPGRACRA